MSGLRYLPVKTVHPGETVQAADRRRIGLSQNDIVALPGAMSLRASDVKMGGKRNDELKDAHGALFAEMKESARRRGLTIGTSFGALPEGGYSGLFKLQFRVLAQIENNDEI